MAVLLILVMASLLINLSSGAQVGQVRQENVRLRQEMDTLRKEYHVLLTHIQNVKQPAPAPAAKPTKDPEPPPPSISPAEQIKVLLQQLQHLLMVFASHHNGQFPDSLDSLIVFADSENLNPLITHPLTQVENPLVSNQHCVDITHQTVEEGKKEQAGKLLYQANLDALGIAESFTLAAFDQDSLLLRTPEGNLLTLGPTEIQAPSELAPPL